MDPVMADFPTSPHRKKIKSGSGRRLYFTHPVRFSNRMRVKRAMRPNDFMTAGPLSSCAKKRVNKRALMCGKPVSHALNNAQKSLKVCVCTKKKKNNNLEFIYAQNMSNEKNHKQTFK